MLHPPCGTDPLLRLGRKAGHKPVSQALVPVEILDRSDAGAEGIFFIGAPFDTIVTESKISMSGRDVVVEFLLCELAGVPIILI